MKFEGDFFSGMLSFGRKVKGIILAPFEMFYRKVAQLINPDSLLSRVSQDIRGGVRDITRKPKAIEEYVLIGKRFVARKLIAIIVMLLMLGVCLSANLLYPKIVSWWFTITMPVNDVAVKEYNGKVRLIDNVEDRNLIFEGVL